MRAKEIERRQQQLRTEPPAVVQDGNDPNPGDKTSESNAARDTLHTETAANQSSLPEQDIAVQREQRSEELQSLQQKEHQVLGNQTPLDPNLLCEAVHQYICTTTSFVNTYVADVDASLEGVDHKLRVLEDQMSLLERRLVSIPGLLEENIEDLTLGQDYAVKGGDTL